MAKNFNFNFVYFNINFKTMVNLVKCNIIIIEFYCVPFLMKHFKV